MARYRIIECSKEHSPEKAYKVQKRVPILGIWHDVNYVTFDIDLPMFGINYFGDVYFKTYEDAHDFIKLALMKNMRNIPYSTFNVVKEYNSKDYK